MVYQMSGQLKNQINNIFNKKEEKKIFTIDTIKVIMNPLNWNNPDHKCNYEVLNVLNKYKYIHVFFYEKGNNWFYDIKFKKSLIELMKNWLKQYYRGETGVHRGS